MNITFKSLNQEEFFPKYHEIQTNEMFNKEQLKLNNNDLLSNDSNIKVIILLLLNNPKYKMHLLQNNTNDIINKSIIHFTPSSFFYENLYNNLISIHPKVNFINHPLNIFHILLTHLYRDNVSKTANDFYMCVTQSIHCSKCNFQKNKFIITNNYYHEIPIYSIIMLTKEENNNNYIVDLSRTIKLERKNSSHNLSKLYNKLFIYYLSHHRNALFVCDNCKTLFNNSNSKLTLQTIPMFLHFSFIQDKHIFKLSLYDSLTILILLPKVFELQQLFEHNNYTGNIFYSLTSILFLTQTNVWSIAIKKQNYWEFHLNNFTNKIEYCNSYFKLIECALKIGAMPLFVAYQQQEKYLDYYENELNVNEIDFLEKYVHNIEKYESSLKDNQLRIKESVIDSFNTSTNNSMNSTKKSGFNNYDASDKTTTSNSTVSKHNNSNINNSLEINYYKHNNTIQNESYGKNIFQTERHNYFDEIKHNKKYNNTLKHNICHSEISSFNMHNTNELTYNKEKVESNQNVKHNKSYRGITEYNNRPKTNDNNSQNKLTVNQNVKMNKQKGNNNKSYYSKRNNNNNMWKCDICDVDNNLNVYRCISCKTINLYQKNQLHKNESVQLTNTPSSVNSRINTPVMNNKYKIQRRNKSSSNIKSVISKNINNNTIDNNNNKYHYHQMTLQKKNCVPKQFNYDMIISNDNIENKYFSIKTK